MARYLFVIARLNLGGTSQYLHQLSKGLIAGGDEVLIATGSVQGAEREDPLVASMPIRRIGSLGRKISPLNDWRARRELRLLIAEYKPDLIYSHTFKAGLLARTIRTSTPRVHAFHGHLLSEPELAGWRSRVVVVIERWLAERACVLVTVGSKVSRELLAERVGSPSQYRSIAPGVVPLALADRELVRREFGIEGETRPVVIWLARVTAVKAPHRVVELARQIPEAFFVLAGGGDLLSELERSSVANLKVVGWQEAAKMWAIADLAISTSENEGMPVALIEAQLAGVPVVGIDVGSVREVVANGATGYVLGEFGSEYVARVRELVGDAKLRAKFASAARERATVEFSPERLLNSHREMFAEILAR